MGPLAEHRGNTTKALSVFCCTYPSCLFHPARRFKRVASIFASSARGARLRGYISFFLEPAPGLICLLCQMHERVHDPCVFVCSWIEEESVIHETDDGGHCAPLVSGGWTND